MDKRTDCSQQTLLRTGDDVLTYREFDKFGTENCSRLKTFSRYANGITKINSKEKQ